MATAICLEQFYDTLPMNVRTWVQDKKPNTCQKARELADEYVQTRQASNTPGIRSHSRPLGIKSIVSCVTSWGILQKIAQ